MIPESSVFELVVPVVIFEELPFFDRMTPNEVVGYCDAVDDDEPVELLRAVNGCSIALVACLVTLGAVLNLLCCTPVAGSGRFGDGDFEIPIRSASGCLLSAIFII